MIQFLCSAGQKKKKAGVTAKCGSEAFADVREEEGVGGGGAKREGKIVEKAGEEEPPSVTEVRLCSGSVS